MPFGNFTFAKSPYVVISWSWIITKCGSRDAIGWSPSEDAKCYSVFGLVFSPFALMLVDSWLPSSLVSRHCALGSSNLPVRLSEKVPVQEKHEFSERIWQTTGLGRALALRMGREEAENVTAPSAGRRFQLLRKHGEAGHLGHAELVLGVGSGGWQAVERGSPITFPPQPYHQPLENLGVTASGTHGLRIKFSLSRLSWVPSLQKALDAGFPQMLERTHVLVSTALASPFTRGALGPLLKFAKLPRFFL